MEELDVDVIKVIFNQLDAFDLWVFKSVSKCWNFCLGQTTAPENVIVTAAGKLLALARWYFTLPDRWAIVAAAGRVQVSKVDRISFPVNDYVYAAAS